LIANIQRLTRINLTNLTRFKNSEKNGGAKMAEEVQGVQEVPQPERVEARADDNVIFVGRKG